MYITIYCISNTDHLEECVKEENVELTGAAAASFWKRINKEINKMILNIA
jgi:hypothetical protein